MLIQLAFAGVAACAALSLWPFSFARRWKSPGLYLPVLALAFYVLYEVALPEAGGQIPAVLPLMLFVWVNGILKVIVLAILMDRSGGSRRRLRGQPQRRWQVILSLPVLLACAAWIWSMWSATGSTP